MIQLLLAGIILVGIVAEKRETPMGVFRVFGSHGNKVAISWDIGIGEVLALGKGPVGSSIDVGVIHMAGVGVGGGAFDHGVVHVVVDEEDLKFGVFVNGEGSSSLAALVAPRNDSCVSCGDFAADSSVIVGEVDGDVA